MSNDNHNKDGFVPNYLLKKLAERGSDSAKKTLTKTKEFHNKIEEGKKNNLIKDLKKSNKHENSMRWIFDSKNTEGFKKKLVRKEGDPPVCDEVANIAYDFCGKTLKYLRNKLGRNSVDNRGMDIICNIHFGYEYDNAFWTNDQLAIGDGDGKLFINLCRSIDVIAHEIAHGVTEFVNKLEYEGQSGALNEHFSDVIGTAVQQFVKGQNAKNADWLIGDEIVGPDFQGKALRSMKAPGTASEIDDQPAHMKDYKELPIDEEHDYGGVHINSGIPNKAFFLVAQEIGTDSAVYLWYNAWMDKEIIHPNATFADAFEAIIKTSEMLVSQGKLPENTNSVVKNAFEEVGIYALIPV
jgi:Zn-dependent metalloprotease